jgi:FXSXX-COOH protein
MNSATVLDHGIAAEAGAGPAIPDISAVPLDELSSDQDALLIVDEILRVATSPSRVQVAAFNSAIPYRVPD